MTRPLTMYYGDNDSLALSLTPDESSEETGILVAVEIYATAWLSTGGTAEPEGPPKASFLNNSAACDIDAFDISEDGLRSDVASARHHP